jgi:hypothetical protein
MVWIESRSPGALQKGATMLVGRRSADGGDVNWDNT